MAIEFEGGQGNPRTVAYSFCRRHHAGSQTGSTRYEEAEEIKHAAIGAIIRLNSPNSKRSRLSHFAFLILHCGLIFSAGNSQNAWNSKNLTVNYGAITAAAQGISLQVQSRAILSRLIGANGAGERRRRCARFRASPLKSAGRRSALPGKEHRRSAAA